MCKLLTEVIIVNNRSTDNSENAVIQYLSKADFNIPVSLLRNDDNYGLGGSHKVAFDYAVKNDFDHVIVLYGDDQGDIANIVPYLKTKEYKRFDCYLGARFMKGSKLEGYSAFRTFGNNVYNIMFSLGVWHKVYDLGAYYYNHRIKFFPILWREDDQVSNVKMVNQAITVLKMLMSYVLNKKKFVEAEHREKILKQYTAQMVCSTQNEELTNATEGIYFNK